MRDPPREGAQRGDGIPKPLGEGLGRLQARFCALAIVQAHRHFIDTPEELGGGT